MNTVTIRLAALVFASLLVGACATPGGGSSTDRIDGRILGLHPDGEMPLAQANIEIRSEGSDTLLGIGVSNSAGNFVIAALADTQLLKDVPLQRNTKYDATIRVPGYWILKQSFDYGRGAEDWVFRLEYKDGTDLGDDRTLDAEYSEGKGYAHGSVKRGT